MNPKIASRTTLVRHVISRRITWPRLLLLMLVTPFILWRVLLPTATVHLSEDAQEPLRFFWNVSDRIYRGSIAPGDLISDTGFIFPDSEFFMEFSWQVGGGRRHCISITPTRSTTHVYLDLNGDIDMSTKKASDASLLKVCQWDLEKP